MKKKGKRTGKGMSKFGIWAFLIGLILIAVNSVFVDKMPTWIYWMILFIVGIAVGYLNVKTTEVWGQFVGVLILLIFSWVFSGVVTNAMVIAIMNGFTYFATIALVVGGIKVLFLNMMD